MDQNMKHEMENGILIESSVLFFWVEGVPGANNVQRKDGVVPTILAPLLSSGSRYSR